MSWWRIGRNKQAEATGTTTLPPCPHMALLPHWDRVEDMGRDELATSFRCESCHTQFAPAEAAALRAAEVERLHRLME